MDVKSTFLNGQIKEDVYDKQPIGFIVPSLEHKVCKLKKTLYGLCQSPWVWHERIDVFLQKTSLVPCLVDLSLYIFQEDGLILAHAIYVDDLICSLIVIMPSLSGSMMNFVLNLICLHQDHLHYIWVQNLSTPPLVCFFPMLVHSKMFV